MSKKEDKVRSMLRATYLETVETQMRDNNPPETRQTYDRLRSEGFDDEDARLLIASAISAESYYILKYHQPYNLERFIMNLNRLPNQDFDEQP
jgi:hypothetical protein